MEFNDVQKPKKVFVFHAVIGIYEVITHNEATVLNTKCGQGTNTLPINLFLAS